jgi:A/G-specific adenine glycosylase
MPWREEHDPYRIWVSEVMLQQTRSDTAADYYRRWMGRFPTVEALAAAGREEVLKAWEGLGYYNRARNLHRAARIIVEEWHGEFPDTEERMRTLPGVGEYTAAAVLSIAFAVPLGVVDGNVLRVVSRLLAQDGSDGPNPPGRLKKLARRYVEASFLHYHPGWVNQAWMELGALTCLPNPHCSRCPLGYTCRAYRENRVPEFPPRPGPRPLPRRAESLLVLLPQDLPSRVSRELTAALDGSTGNTLHSRFGAAMRFHRIPLLLVRRADIGLLGGLWELPNYPDRGRQLEQRLQRLSIEILKDTGEEIRHRYSHFEIRFRIFLAAFAAKRRLDPWEEQRWVLPGDLDRYPRPKVHIKAMKHLGLVTN